MFKKIFMGKSGYIYKVKKDNFVDDKRLGLYKFEKISYHKAEIIEKEYISDVWEKLQKTKIKFIFSYL